MNSLSLCLWLEKKLFMLLVHLQYFMCLFPRWVLNVLNVPLCFSTDLLLCAPEKECLHCPFSSSQVKIRRPVNSHASKAYSVRILFIFSLSLVMKPCSTVSVASWLQGFSPPTSTFSLQLPGECVQNETECFGTWMVSSVALKYFV